jgi:hypothetical protein
VAELPAAVVLFTSSRDETGKLWCSDCVKADPTIVEEVVPFCNLHKIPFFVFETGPKSGYNKDHPFKTHPKAKVRCIPTLAKLSHGKVGLRLEESEILNKELLNDLLNS